MRNKALNIPKGITTSLFAMILITSVLVIMPTATAEPTCPCNEAIIKNCDFNDMTSDTHWSKSQYIKYTNEAEENTNSWWGNDPENPCLRDRGWWSDASVSQAFTLPSDAETLRWNVCTGCGRCTDGSQDYQYNARVSVKINEVYIVDHYQPL